jgi:hypothetical protein
MASVKYQPIELEQQKDELSGNVNIEIPITNNESPKPTDAEWILIRRAARGVCWLSILQLVRSEL